MSYNFQHRLKYKHFLDLWVCKAGSCGLTKTREELEEAGHCPHKAGVVLVNDDDFRKVKPCTTIRTT